MKEKCTKYEALFTFSDEKDFFKHLDECEDCRAEHEKMNKISFDAHTKHKILWFWENHPL